MSNYRIVNSTHSHPLAEKYFNPPLLITDGIHYNVSPLGTADLYSIIPREDAVYLVSENFRLDYVGITRYNKEHLSYVDSVFFQEGEIDDKGLRDVFENGVTSEIIDLVIALKIEWKNDPPMNAY